jgi:hypothetical protein
VARGSVDERADVVALALRPAAVDVGRQFGDGSVAHGVDGTAPPGGRGGHGAGVAVPGGGASGSGDRNIENSFDNLMFERFPLPASGHRSVRSMRSPGRDFPNVVPD